MHNSSVSLKVSFSVYFPSCLPPYIRYKGTVQYESVVAILPVIFLTIGGGLTVMVRDGWNQSQGRFESLNRLRSWRSSGWTTNRTWMDKTPNGTSVGVDDPYDYVDRCDHLTDDGSCRYAVD